MSGSVVLVVAHVGRFGGSAVALGSMIDHLDPDAHRVCAGSFYGPVLDAYLRSGTVDEAIPIRWRGWRAPLAAARLAGWSWRRRRRLVAILANGTIDLLLAFPAALVTRRPLFVWVHDQAPKRWPTRLAFLIRRLDVRWMAVSQFTAADLVATRLAEPGEVEIVHNPVDPAVVAGLPRIPDSDLRVGFLGADTERKGFPLVADVAERVTRPGVRLVVFANHHHNREPRIVEAWRKLRALGPERVEIVGRVSDVREAYARCDVVLVPSVRESFGRILVEAMCNGVPAVASDLPPFRETLGPDRPGLLFPPGDAEAAAEALNRLLDDGVLRTRLANSCRARAEAFAPQQIARRFDTLFGTIAPASSPDAPQPLDASGTAG